MGSATNMLLEWSRHVSPELLAQIEGSRVGVRWERKLRQHSHEIEALAAVHPDVRSHLIQALEHLTIAFSEGEITDATIEAACLALDDLHRHGGIELCRMVGSLREEVLMLQGHNLAQALSD